MESADPSGAIARANLPATERSHYVVLDGLRGTAACLVVLAHSSLFRYPSAAAARWAVDLFFVLSGFLITRILLANRVQGQLAWTFWLNRAARIFPIYYLTIGIVWLVSQDPLAPWAAVYLSNYRYALVQPPSALNHTWSLCIEEHFYLVWPFIVSAVNPRTSRRLVIVMMTAGALLCFVMGELSYFSVTSRVLSLGAGSLFAYAEPSFRLSPRRLLPVGIWLLTLGAILFKSWDPCLSLARTVSDQFARGVDTFCFLATMASTCAAVLALSLWTETGPRLLRLILANRLLRSLGLISYGLYLYHYPIFRWVGVFTPSPEPTTIAIRGLTITLVTSIVSYNVLEMPIRRVAKRFIAVRVAASTAPGLRRRESV